MAWIDLYFSDFYKRHVLGYRVDKLSPQVELKNLILTLEMKKINRKQGSMNETGCKSLTYKYYIVQFQKNPYPPHGRSSEIPRGRGVLKVKI